jgi:hypothetical protein
VEVVLLLEVLAADAGEGRRRIEGRRGAARPRRFGRTTSHPVAGPPQPAIDPAAAPGVPAGTPRIIDPAPVASRRPVVAVAQLVRAPDCGSGGRGFKSLPPPHPIQ